MDFTRLLVGPVTSMVITATDFILTHEENNEASLALLFLKAPHILEVQGAGVPELISIVYYPLIESTPVLADQHRIFLGSINHKCFLFLVSPVDFVAINGHFGLSDSFLFELNSVKAPPFGKDSVFGRVISLLRCSGRTDDSSVVFSPVSHKIVKELKVLKHK